MGDLRVGVVGMGIGQRHLLSLRAIERASATVFAEIDDAKRTKGEADWSIPGVASLDELLAAVNDPTSPQQVDVIACAPHRCCTKCMSCVASMSACT